MRTGFIVVSLLPFVGPVGGNQRTIVRSGRGPRSKEPSEGQPDFSVTASALTWGVLLEWRPVRDGVAYAETTFQIERGLLPTNLTVYARNVPGVDTNTSSTFGNFNPPVHLVSHFIDTQAEPGRRYVYRVSEKLNGSLTGKQSGVVDGVAAGDNDRRLRHFPRGGAAPRRVLPPPRSRLGMWDLISIGDHRCPTEAQHAGITETFWSEGVASIFEAGSEFEQIQKWSSEIWWTLRFPFGSYTLQTSPGTCEKLWVQPIGRRLRHPMNSSCPYYTNPLQWTTIPGGCPSLLLQYWNDSVEATRLLDTFVPTLAQYVSANGTHFGYYMAAPAHNRATTPEALLDWNVARVALEVPMTVMIDSAGGQVRLDPVTGDVSPVDLLARSLDARGIDTFLEPLPNVNKAGRQWVSSGAPSVGFITTYAAYSAAVGSSCHVQPYEYPKSGIVIVQAGAAPTRTLDQAIFAALKVLHNGLTVLLSPVNQWAQANATVWNKLLRAADIRSHCDQFNTCERCASAQDSGCIWVNDTSHQHQPSLHCRLINATDRRWHDPLSCSSATSQSRDRAGNPV